MLYCAVLFIAMPDTRAQKVREFAEAAETAGLKDITVRKLIEEMLTFLRLFPCSHRPTLQILSSPVARPYCYRSGFGP